MSHNFDDENQRQSVDDVSGIFGSMEVGFQGRGSLFLGAQMKWMV